MTPDTLRHFHPVKVCHPVILACLLSLVACPLHAGNKSYAIVVASSPGSNLAWSQDLHPIFSDMTFFVESITIKNRPWERLYIGYCSSRRKCLDRLKQVKEIYPGAWINKTPADNIRLIKKPATRSVTKKTKIALSDKQLKSLMKRAKEDFTAKRYKSAIRYLTALVNAGSHKYSADALELLGLSRQRNNQKSHAVEAYEKYLELYPDSDGVSRVKQRLAGLLTASRSAKQRINLTTVEIKDEVMTFGSVSQFYRYNRASSDDIGTFTSLSQLISFIDLTTIQKSENFDHRYQFSVDHTYDFLGNGDRNELRFIETYYEASIRTYGHSARIGRQSLRIGGILNRFDGVSAGYQITPDMRFNFLGGFPVETDNKTSINNQKSFYGFTFETGTFLQDWDMNLFYFHQTLYF